MYIVYVWQHSNASLAGLLGGVRAGERMENKNVEGMVSALQDHVIMEPPVGLEGACTWKSHLMIWSIDWGKWRYCIRIK